VSAEVELRMLESSEFQIVGSCNAKTVRSKGCANIWNQQQMLSEEYLVLGS